MEILAINAMNLERQGETTAVTRAAPESQANGDFATELDRKLQVQTNPALTGGVSEPECAPGKSSTFKDANRSRQAVGHSTGSLAASVAALPVTSPSSSTAGDRAAPDPEQAATVTSDSPTGASPEEIASTLAKDPVQLANDGGEETVNPQGGASGEQCVSAQAVVQNAAVRKPNPNAGNVHVEATQASTRSLKPDASQDESSKAPSVNNVLSAEDNSIPPPISLAPALETGQDGSAKTAESTSEQVDSINVTSPSRSDIGVQSSGVETLAPSKKVAKQLELQDSSSGLMTSAELPLKNSPGSQSRAWDVANLNAQISTRGQQSRAEVWPVPFHLAMTQSTLANDDASHTQDLTASSADEAAPAEAGSTTQPSKAGQAGAMEQEGSTLVVGSVLKPDGRKTTVPDASKGATGEASSAMQSSQAAQAVAVGQEASAPANRAAPTWEWSEAASPSNLRKGSQATGVGMPAPSHEVTRQLESRDSAGAPEASPHQQATSGPEPPSSARDASDPNVQVSTVSSISPDSSLSSMPIELTKGMPIGRLDVPQNSNRIQNSQVAKSSTSESDKKVDLGIAGAALSQQPAQTKDVETGASKKDGEASPDATKAAVGKGSVSKTDADPPLASQLIPEGRAEGSRASLGATGASQSWGAPRSASVSAGCQADAETVVCSARLTQQAGNAEMQVRLRSEALGPIDVHTIVKGNDIGASIRVEGRDTQVMLANELSQLERALNERSLRVDHLDVLQGSAFGGRSTGTGQGNSDRSPLEPPPGLSSYSTGQTYPSLAEAPTVSEEWGLGLSMTRLNLRV